MLAYCALNAPKSPLKTDVPAGITADCPGTDGELVRGTIVTLFAPVVVHEITFFVRSRLQVGPAGGGGGGVVTVTVALADACAALELPPAVQVYASVIRLHDCACSPIFFNFVCQ